MKLVYPPKSIIFNTIVFITNKSYKNKRYLRLKVVRFKIKFNTIVILKLIAYHLFLI